MKREKIIERLNKVFRDVFDDESITITDSTAAKDIDAWNSLIHITLISEIEDEFNVEFEMEDVTEMKNVGEITDRIMELI